MAQKSRKPRDKAAARARREARRERTVRTRAAAEANRRAAKRREWLVAGGVGVAIIAVIAGAFLGFRALDNSAATSDPPAGITDESGLELGEAEAARSVVVYEDFLCPACASLEGATTQALTAAAESGDVRVEYRPVSILGHIDDYSLRAANAFAVVLDTAGPEAAKEFHDLLFADQPAESGPFPDDAWLVEKAVEAGAEESEVTPGIEDLGFEGWVEDATDAFSRSGHSGTPTVLVDGNVVTGQTIQEVAQAVLGATQG